MLSTFVVPTAVSHKKSYPMIWRSLKNSLIMYAILILRQGTQICYLSSLQGVFLDRRPLKGDKWSTFVVPNFSLF